MWKFRCLSPSRSPCHGPLFLTAGGHSSVLGLWHAVNLPERERNLLAQACQKQSARKDTRPFIKTQHHIFFLFSRWRYGAFRDKISGVKHKSFMSARGKLPQGRGVVEEQLWGRCQWDEKPTLQVESSCSIQKSYRGRGSIPLPRHTWIPRGRTDLCSSAEHQGSPAGICVRLVFIVLGCLRAAWEKRSQGLQVGREESVKSVKSFVISFTVHMTWRVYLFIVYLL